MAQGKWNVDPSHSSVEFQVKHMGLATVKGFFGEFEGGLEVAEDGSVTAGGRVKAASINTRNDQRDEHLRSADFFDVENHPEISFRSTKVEQLDEETYRITGDLTMRGTTKEIVLEATVTGTDQDPWGNTRVGLEASGQLDRTEWGLTWNQALESGGVLVGKRVKILLDISAVKA
ncbi:MAG: YceI family protein [Thermoleophilaceae bacterium]|nr:YceI family protein [Thermoleophilaceae bacterium]